MIELETLQVIAKAVADMNPTVAIDEGGFKLRCVFRCGYHYEVYTPETNKPHSPECPYELARKVQS
jgi:hypothetical protein